MNIKRTIIAVLLLSISLMAASKNVQLDTWATSLNGVNATGAGDDFRLYEPSRYATFYTWSAISWQTSFTGTPTAITVQLQGSNNGTTWEVLDSSTSTAGESRSVVGKFYDRIRCNISAYTVNSSTANCKVKGVSAATDPVFSSVTVGGELNRAPRLLNAFGDSITAGEHSTTPSARWVNRVAAAKGWTLNNQGVGGGSLPNIWTSVYGTTVTSSTVSTMLVGNNDAVPMGTATNGPYNWLHGLLGTYLYLLTPNKILANSASVTKTGTWVDSDLVTFGLKSTVDGSTAKVYMLGTAVYVVAHGTNTNVATITVTVDSVNYGPYVIANNYQTKDTKYDIPWGIRIAGLSNKLHTVTATCTTNTTGTCYLDYFASNSGQLTRSGPFLWVGSPSKNRVTPYSRFEVMDTQIRTAVNQLASDGLGIVHVDVLGACGAAYGVVSDSDYGCAQYDDNHPDDAAHGVIANAFLSDMDNFPSPQAKQAGRSAATDTVDVVSSTFMGLNGGVSANYTVRMVTERDLLIRRVIVGMESQMAGCTTAPRLVLCKGGCVVGTSGVVLLNGANATGTIDSGPLEVTIPAGLFWFQWQDGAGCSNFGSNFHIHWMYRMARD